MKQCTAIFSVLATLALLSGCAEPITTPPTGFAFDRGARLLSAGSPKSAIPFLTQTVASTPDGPEPVALLALAYALDLQDERAIYQARKVHRAPGAPPGWEFVAVGIAKMTEHRPEDAIMLLKPVARTEATDDPVALSARQWLALAQILNNDNSNAIETLQSLSHLDQMQTSAMLWVALLELQAGHKDLAIAALRQCAKPATTGSGRLALATGDAALNRADDQTLYDAAVSAMAAGNVHQAEDLFRRVQEHTTDSCDTAVWLALLAGLDDNWQETRNQLKDAVENGPAQSRGLASQLFSVVCAIEDRPDEMVEFTLLGQRLMGRSSDPSYIHEQPKPEPVWYSDQMK